MIKRKYAMRYLASALGVIALATGGGLALTSAAGSAQAEKATRVKVDGPRVVGMRRLTESQYRNAIADIFGPGITLAGHFEPIVRTTHQLIASGSTISSISPTGLEQFDSMARGVAAQVFDERHRDTFVPCKPKSDTTADARCARDVLTSIGRYLMRRPLTARERDAYVAMAATATKRTGSFYSGLELALSAMLVAPEFLYVVESAEPDPANPGQLVLDNYSRASRLSFLLWDTTPDKALLDAAAAGKLTDPAQLEAHATRLVGSPRLEQGVRAFFADMLLFEKFDELAKDSVVYPRFNPDVARALPEQLERTIVGHLLNDRGDYRALFTTPNTYMTRALGPLYYVHVNKRTGWEPYKFAEGDERAGLIGQAGFLALYAHSGRSSPTLRGKAVRELLLCQPVPDPPGNVNFTVVQDTKNPKLRTARDRLSAHATDASCSGCHRITDPIGLSLEGFDGIGAARKEENGQVLDLSGQMDSSIFKGASGLGKTLAADPALTQCAASRVLEYTVGRPVDDQEEAVNALLKAFTDSGYRFPELMLKAATLPAAYRIKSAPLSPKPNVAQISQRRSNGASR